MLYECTCSCKNLNGLTVPKTCSNVVNTSPARMSSLSSLPWWNGCRHANGSLSNK